MTQSFQSKQRSRASFRIVICLINAVFRWKEKATQHLFSYFQIAPKYSTYFKTHPLSIIFDGFGIWLLGYRIQLSCLYIPQWHNCISTLWLWSIDEYVFYFFERKSTFNIVVSVKRYETLIHVHLCFIRNLNVYMYTDSVE